MKIYRKIIVTNYIISERFASADYLAAASTHGNDFGTGGN